MSPSRRGRQKPRALVPRGAAARWWSVRPARNRRAATYRCPLCGTLLLAATEHMLIAPEGDASRRRHAHTACVLRERRAGRLPLREDITPTAPRRRPLRALIRRLLGRASTPTDPPPALAEPPSRR